MRRLHLTLTILLGFLSLAAGFGLGASHGQDLLQAGTRTTTVDVETRMTRSSFLTWTAASLVALSPSPVAAKEVDPALKGTKKDPAFETCVSTCMYDCTKPKGTEQKSRAECLPECKQKCATTKAQLMIGTPLDKQ